MLIAKWNTIPFKTPAAIVPEWYLLPFYAILRSIPNKLLGVIFMLVAILIIISLSFLDKSNFKGSQYKPGFRIVIIIFFTTVVILGILGGKHVEYPYIGLGAGSTVVYFSLRWLYFVRYNRLK